jgi:flagellar basal-body rod protein FlgB
MIDAIFNQAGYVTAKKMLDATALRHEAIASNLANLETPNYRRVDVAPNFSADLRQAIQSGDSAQISSQKPALAIDANALSSNRDGNTVQLENELLALNQNTTDHALETQLVSGQLFRLRMAITGRTS